MKLTSTLISLSALLLSTNIQAEEYRIISPHHDDALLVFSGYISSLNLTNESDERIVDVMFGASNYSTNHLDVLTDKRVLTITKARYAEDYDALTDLFTGWDKFRFRSYGYYDAPLRKYVGDVTAGGGPAGTFRNFRQIEIDTFNMMVHNFTSILQRENCTLLVPIANGIHIDHFMTKEAVITAAYKLGKQAKCKIKFGQDQPYTDANPQNVNLEIAALKSRLPDGAITEEVYDIPLEPGTNETIKLNKFKKHYVTQYDTGYIGPLTSNLREVVYVWDPATYGQVKSHRHCDGSSYCRLAP
ncbi:putative LmbE-like protein [Vibrio nigripulchritudo SFn27]|uniref:Putative LmbE-like protein n=1 Tax=Vibrio nigripulchritudo TaxID=28173 RepID=U4KCJ5_9VIBR|nr:PIG-L family deacetylase [Vibrio nigripulchritudo]CCN80484.1 putative LmbE-like protein [Vibrio nigripulchritudo BLFn1]CCN88264.1 putative LmbE-like protein [Vibrio nigripulchritudo SFn27]CCN95586.1 putative LmbE-like protein [Vibrio nigripulchritudo ENn2]CCO42046.1 putative LmbE-like protein [Vibrio nigripulchritudo SFn135]CCO50467.1 putative LmbE-like protein [Vibrio nigripulchritudo Wn13]